MINDTIAGVSTAVGNSGISVIRLRTRCFSIADKIFKGKHSVSEQESHTIQYGKSYQMRPTRLLTRYFIKMEAPRTYTREDVGDFKPWLYHCIIFAEPALQ